MNSKWTGPGGYMKRHSQPIASFTRHSDRENCWVGFIEGRAAIAYLRKISSDRAGTEQESLVIFDDPNGEQSRSDVDER